ncbi:MAG: hypothetical protein ACJ8M4_11960 [Chthoniobacterales bacterium]
MKNFGAIVALAFFMGGFAAQACDVCGCYTPQLEGTSHIDPNGALDPLSNHGSLSDRFYAGVAEQFTHFGTLQFDGDEVANPTGQYLDSSITQLLAGYSITPRFALQVNAPFIYRSFERPEGFAIDRGTESGIGDVSLLAKYVLFQIERGGSGHVDFTDSKSPRIVKTQPDFTASAVLIAGVKFPTGDASRLEEEFNEEEIPGAPQSGIHGHDLALGTGSYDGIFAEQTLIRYRNLFFQADAQFALRGPGRHQYNFANDTSWSGGPGYYLLRNEHTTVGLQFVVSGEHKDLDRFRGQPVEDTGITSVFVGPRIIASLGNASGEIGLDVPVGIDNTALQVVPDFRVRGGFAIRF